MSKEVEKSGFPVLLLSEEFVDDFCKCSKHLVDLASSASGPGVIFTDGFSSQSVLLPTLVLFRVPISS